MKHLITLMALTLLLTACDPLDTGEPPTISTFTATAINESQIQLAWSADNISDDLIQPYNLRAGIWYAKAEDGLDIDNLGSPNHTTEEGALSFNLVGLDAETEYDIVVRVNDRAQYSLVTSSDVQSVTTLKAGEGTGFGPAIATTLTDQPNRLVAGKAVDPDGLGTNGNVGLMFDDRIVWYARSTGGTLVSINSETIITEGVIRDAILVKAEANAELDHMFMLTSSQLRYYTQQANNTNGSVLGNPSAVDGAGIAGTFSYRSEDGALDVFSYMRENGQAVLGKMVEDPATGQDPFTVEPYILNDTNALISLAKLDDDEFYDLVIFDSANRILVDKSTNEAMSSWEGFTEITTLGSDELGSGNYFASLFLVKGSSNYNIYIFVRNEEADLTRLVVLTGKGDGTFDDPTIVDYEHHFYGTPTMAVAGATDSLPDLLVPQTSSNNAAVYFSSSYTTPIYYGIDGIPSQVLAAPLDGQNGSDLIIYDSINRTINVLYDL